MKAKIVITNDGKIMVVTEEGTFEEGKQAIMKLLAELQASGITFEEIGAVEQHRHDDEEVHQHHHHHEHN